MRPEEPVREQARPEAGVSSTLLEEAGPVDEGDGGRPEKISAPLPQAEAGVRIAVPPVRLRAYSDGTLRRDGYAARPVVRRRGPGVAGYLVLLCVRPEQWAQAARYKLRLTLAALVLGTLVVSVGVGIHAGRMVVPAARVFAANYDGSHPALKYAQGKLTAADGAEAGAAGKVWPKFLLNGVPVVVDPTGTTMQGAGEPGILLDQKTLTLRGGMERSEISWRLSTLEEAAKWLGWSGGAFTINSASLGRAIDKYGADIALGAGIGTALREVLGTLLWAVITAFLAIPVVQLLAHKLAMPRRIAFRVSLAVTVPLVVLDGSLKMAGISASAVMPADWVLVFWFGCAAALAGWAGWMANGEFGRQKTRGI